MAKEMGAMKNYAFKGILTDYDGVLVDSLFNFRMPHEIKAIILKLIQNGYIFSIATGRPYQGVIEKVCNDLCLRDPQIVSGGARIIVPKTKTVLWTRYVKSKIAEKLINFFAKENFVLFDIVVESDGKMFTPQGQICKDCGPYIKFEDIQFLKIDKIEKIRIVQPLNKITQRKLYKLLADNQKFVNSTRFRTGKVSGFDITSSDTSKYTTALELMRLVDLSPSDFIGIGDGPNDLPLLKACGYKIALQNAPNEVKSIANYIAPDFDNGGFINIFEHLLNL